MHLRFEQFQEAAPLPRPLHTAQNAAGYRCKRDRAIRLTGARAIRPEPQPATSETLPEPPEFLAPSAIDEWYRVGPELHRLGLRTVLDVSALAAYCESYSIWRQAAAMLRVAAKDDPTTNGLLVRGSSGSVTNPLVKIARSAAADMWATRPSLE